jgi:hypothetical protein
VKIFSKEIPENFRMAIWVGSGILNMVLVLTFLELYGYPVMESIVTPVVNLLTIIINKTL